MRLCPLCGKELVIVSYGLPVEEEYRSCSSTHYFYEYAYGYYAEYIDGYTFYSSYLMKPKVAQKIWKNAADRVDALKRKNIYA